MAKNLYRATTFIVITLISTLCFAQKTSSFYKKDLEYHRKSYKKGFIKDERSPLVKKDLRNLDFYPSDEQWNLKCPCVTEENGLQFDMPTYSGIKKPYKIYARAHCSHKKDTFSVTLYQSFQPMNPLASSYLFLPFKDETNSETTYGGGRYINLTINDIKDGYITIDFNKSYNPWCAYSDGYNCPIPPKENHLEIQVNAGEKKYKGSYKNRHK